jgi:hypothetical protein
MSFQYLKSMGYNDSYLRKKFPEQYAPVPAPTSLTDIAVASPRTRTKTTVINDYVYDEELEPYQNFAKEVVGLERLTTNKLRKMIFDFIEQELDDDAW